MLFNDDYKGIRVGVEVRLGEELPASSLVTTIILLEEIKRRDPRVFNAAIRAMQELQVEEKNVR